MSSVKTPKTKKTLEPKIDNSFKLKEIFPLTETQKTVFSQFEEGQNLVMMGTAGTGKTFCSAYLALKSLMERKNSVDHPSRVLFIRSVVSTRDVGFLPGTLKEKLAVYEAPYKGIFAELLQRGDAWEILKTKGIVDFLLIFSISKNSLSSPIASNSIKSPTTKRPVILNSFSFVKYIPPVL